VPVLRRYAPAMNAASQVFVALAGVLHLGIFVMESVLFGRPQVWRRFLISSQADADTARPWALNQGFYNLFLALGALGGLVFGGDRGHAIALFACGCMALAGVVLVVTDRRMLRAAAMQAGPPILALVLALF
jgi:putative membrane protein